MILYGHGIFSGKAKCPHTSTPKENTFVYRIWVRDMATDQVPTFTTSLTPYFLTLSLPVLWNCGQYRAYKNNHYIDSTKN